MTNMKFLIEQKWENHIIILFPITGNEPTEEIPIMAKKCKKFLQERLKDRFPRLSPSNVQNYYISKRDKDTYIGFLITFPLHKMYKASNFATFLQSWITED